MEALENKEDEQNTKWEDGEMNHFLGSIEYDLILVFIGILFFRMVFLKLYMSEKERIISFFLTSAGLIIGIGCVVLSDRIGIDYWIKNLVYLYLGCVVLWWNTIIIYTKWKYNKVNNIEMDEIKKACGAFFILISILLFLLLINI